VIRHTTDLDDEDAGDEDSAKSSDARTPAREVSR